MPPRKAARKGRPGGAEPGRAAVGAAVVQDDSDGEAFKEEEGHSHITAQRSDDDDDDDEDEDDLSRQAGTKRSAGGIKKLEMKRWRRLAVEEKEALTNEGGIVWRAAQRLMAPLPSKSKREMAATLASTLRVVEEKLDSVLVPQTVRMPQLARNSGFGAGLAPIGSSGSIAGSVMSWQVERGDRLFEEAGMGESGEEELEEQEKNEVALLELGGFSSDIAVLEALLLPEATETVSMTRALEEQERELESLKDQLSQLKADRETRLREHSGDAAEVRRLHLRRGIMFVSLTHPPIHYVAARHPFETCCRGARPHGRRTAEQGGKAINTSLSSHLVSPPMTFSRHACVTSK